MKLIVTFILMSTFLFIHTALAVLAALHSSLHGSLEEHMKNGPQLIDRRKVCSRMYNLETEQNPSFGEH